jgi:hypothetical protein
MGIAVIIRRPSWSSCVTFCALCRLPLRLWALGFGQSSPDRYKYILDIDGNGWSARFKRLMSTNSAVLKSTIFPEW